MNVLISGGNGYVGERLKSYLEEKGHEVSEITRDLYTDNLYEELKKVVSEADVVINLAGAPISNRWTYSHRIEMYNSRINTTQRIVEAINDTKRVSLFISASAVGFYSHKGCYDEDNVKKGSGFLAQLADDWEEEARKVRKNIRVAITRFGIVLSPCGKTFEKLVSSIPFGFSPILGSGRQNFSWIDREDLVRVMEFIINKPELSGDFNLTTSQKLEQKDVARIIARHYKVKLLVKIPKLLLKIIYGDGAEIILEGQCVSPKRLLEAGFHFVTPTLETFLDRIEK